MLNIKSRKSLFLMLVVGLMGISSVEARKLTQEEASGFSECFGGDWTRYDTDELVKECLHEPFFYSSRHNRYLIYYQYLLRDVKVEKKQQLQTLLRELGVTLSAEDLKF